MRSILLAFVGTIPLILAQTTTDSAAAATSSGSATSSQPVTHTIGVAKGGFTFVPNVVLAEVGDYIEYQFYPTNHSVVRSEYGYPCIPYEDTGVDRIGFFSGFMPVDTILPDPPSYTIRVNDTEPIFYYCSAPGSCITYGMVGVINPNGTESVAVQTQLAKNSTFMLQPGEAWPSEETNPFTTTSSAAPSSTSAPTSTSATVPAASATTSAAVAASKGSSGLSSGGIAGVVIGGVAVALFAAALLFMCGRQSRKRNSMPPPAPYPVTYVDPSGKHMSVMSHPYQPDPRASTFYGRQSAGYASPAPVLPGYIPPHDPSMSPQLHPVRPESTPLHPGGASDNTGPRSPSPSDVGNRSADGAIVPAYPEHGDPQMVPAHGVYEIPSHGPHELHAGTEPQQSGGMMGFMRRNSIRKSGGVERYG